MSTLTDTTRIYIPHGVGTMTATPGSILSVNLLTVATAVSIILAGAATLYVLRWVIAHSKGHSVREAAQSMTGALRTQLAPVVVLLCAMAAALSAAVLYHRIEVTNAVAMQAQRQEVAAQVTLYFRDVGVDQDAVCANPDFGGTLACGGIDDAHGIDVGRGGSVDLYKVDRFGRTVAVDATSTRP